MENKLELRNVKKYLIIGRSTKTNESYLKTLRNFFGNAMFMHHIKNKRIQFKFREVIRPGRKKNRNRLALN